MNDHEKLEYVIESLKNKCADFVGHKKNDELRHEFTFNQDQRAYKKVLVEMNLIEDTDQDMLDKLVDEIIVKKTSKIYTEIIKIS